MLPTLSCVFLVISLSESPLVLCVSSLIVVFPCPAVPDSRLFWIPCCAYDVIIIVIIINNVIVFNYYV